MFINEGHLFNLINFVLRPIFLQTIFFSLNRIRAIVIHCSSSSYILDLCSVEDVYSRKYIKERIKNDDKDYFFQTKTKDKRWETNSTKIWFDNMLKLELVSQMIVSNLFDLSTSLFVKWSVLLMLLTIKQTSIVNDAKLNLASPENSEINIRGRFHQTLCTMQKVAGAWPLAKNSPFNFTN